MSTSRADDAIRHALLDFNLSDCDDEDSELYEEDLQLQDTTVEEVQRPEEEESDWDSSDEEPLQHLVTANRRAAQRPTIWKHTTDFRPQVQLQNLSKSPVNPQDPGNIKKPIEYFERYLNAEFFALMSFCTNVVTFSRTGKTLNTSGSEIQKFVGASMVIGLLGMPRICQYWALETRCELLASAITRNRYFDIRSNLKVINDTEVPDSTKSNDCFWKIRPIVSEIERACRENIRDKNVSIDEQILPYTGRCVKKQLVKGKPNPEGIKIFVAANSDGLPLDLYLYEGKGSSVESVLYPTPEKLDVGGRMVLKLQDTLPVNTSIYIDRYFTSIPLLDVVRERGCHGTGILMKNKVPKREIITKRNGRDTKVKQDHLKSDNALKKLGRGSRDSIVRQDDKIAIVKWLDNKPIFIASTETAVNPSDKCKRWSKKEKQHIEVFRPAAIKLYNAYMGGIDLLDRVLGKYAMRGRTGKWTVRAIFHFIDFAATASWIEYRRDAKACDQVPSQYFDFKMELAKTLIFASQNINPDNPYCERSSPRLSPAASITRSLKTRAVTPLPHPEKKRQPNHLPEDMTKVDKNRSKCRFSGCKSLTFIKCTDCNVYLCFNSNRFSYPVINDMKNYVLIFLNVP